MAYALKWSDTTLVSPDEYLRREKAAQEKSEYWNGAMVAMAGATPDHNKLTTDVTIALGRELGPTGCGIYNSDQRIRLTSTRAYFYPDVSVVCGTEAFDEDHCLLNPIALIQVLSESTEQYDRVTKWLYYQQLPSLRAYVLISQEQILVEIFERESDDASWIYRSYTKRGDSVRFHSLGISLTLAEIYRRITFVESGE